ncbi:MAG: hypothetical protein ACFFCS_15235 [Candidatus Hodarchaeota archaeon]
MSDLVVVLSYFDRKVGPICYMEIPEKEIGGDIRVTLNQIFDQTSTESFFSHSIQGAFASSLNYYFEIKSDWARGSKEMLMVSVVFKNKISSAKETEVLSWVIDFAQKIKSLPSGYKAFYYTSKGAYTSKEVTDINQKYMTIQKWLKDLYWSTKEEIREKTEEEVIANLMTNNALLNTIKKLSKYPVKLDKLKKWFKEQQFMRDFDNILKLLEEHKFVFINNIGHETYVLLVKDIHIMRVPPSCVMELFDKKDVLQPLVEYYIAVVGEFFDNYNTDQDNKPRLYSILSGPKHYNLITELRKGPIVKSKINSILRQGPVVASRINVLEELKNEDIIDEFPFLDNVYLILKTDINIQTRFPEYIQKALPEQDKPDYSPRGLEFMKLTEDMKEAFPMDGDIPLDSGVGEVFENIKVPDVENSILMEESPFDIVVDEISLKFAKESEDTSKEDLNKEDNKEG